MGVGEFALSIILNLVSSLIYDSIDNSDEDFFTKRRIKQRVENSVADVVEPLIPFLNQEGVSEDKQRRLIQTCIDELRPLTENSELLFQGSLDGQKIFDDLYPSNNYPQVILEDDLQSVYSLLCPRIATVICKVPAAVKDWESKAWAESYRRLDEVRDQLINIFSVVDNLAQLPSQSADENLNLVRRTLAQKVLFDLDLTGLRANNPISGRFDDFFVHPEIKEILISDSRPEAEPVRDGSESFSTFTQSNSRFILYGKAGSGKSTWTKWLQKETVSNRWNGISVRIELRKFLDAPLPSIQALIRESAGQHIAENLTAERVSYWIQSKQIIFILDGFDEIPPSERDRFLTWIQEMGMAAQGCPLIVSSRSLTTDHLENLYSCGWQPWEIQPFDLPRIVDYIQRWYEFKPLLQEMGQAIDAQSLAQEWQREPTISPLTGNPLLLSTLLMVHHLDGQLPSGRSKLYQRYIDGMFGIWDQRRNVPGTEVSLTQDQKRQILRRLALHLFLKEREEIDEAAATQWLKELFDSLGILFSPNEVLTNLLERSGLIVGPGTFSFIHKSVAEFLVAESVDQGDQYDYDGQRIDRLYLLNQVSDDRWNTVIFLWAGIASVADLEGFIGGCIHLRDFPLALGILADQYQKFEIGIKRNLLIDSLQLLKSEDLMDSHSSFGYSYSSIYDPCTKSEVTIDSHYSKSLRKGTDFVLRELKIPGFQLRSLSQHVSFDDLLFNAITEKIILWRDREGLCPLLQDFFWMRFRYHSGYNEQDIIASFETGFPLLPSPELWCFSAIEGICARVLVLGEKIDLKAISSELKNRCYLAYTMLPLGLISSCFISYLWQAENNNEKVLFEEIVNLDSLVEILSDHTLARVNEISPGLLLGTLSWNSHPMGLFQGKNAFSEDILETMLLRMNSWPQKGYLKESEKYNKTVNYLQELIAYRSTINAHEVPGMLLEYFEDL